MLPTCCQTLTAAAGGFGAVLAIRLAGPSVPVWEAVALVLVVGVGVQPVTVRVAVEDAASYMPLRHSAQRRHTF
jgi:hypothetical protein